MHILYLHAWYSIIIIIKLWIKMLKSVSLTIYFYFLIIYKKRKLSHVFPWNDMSEGSLLKVKTVSLETIRRWDCKGACKTNNANQNLTQLALK